MNSHMMEGKHSKRDSGHHEDEKVRQSAKHGDFDPLDGGKSNIAAGRMGGTTAEEANRSATLAERQHERGHTSTSTGVGAAGVGGIAGQSHSHAGTHGSHAHGDDGLLRGEKGTSSVGHNDRLSNPTSQTTGSDLGKKPSLMDRLNPMKDADGDGNKGFMS